MKRTILYNNIDGSHQNKTGSTRSSPYIYQNGTTTTTNHHHHQLNHPNDVNHDDTTNEHIVVDGGSSGPFIPLEETLENNSSNEMNRTNQTVISRSSSNIARHHHHQQQSHHDSNTSPIGPRRTVSSNTGSVSTSIISPSLNTTTPTTKLPSSILRMIQKLDAKKVISSTVFTFIFLLVYDSLMSSPEHRVLQPNFANHFLLWVQDHPSSGLIWILLVMSIAVIFMIPIGTPLTLGCGYIYKGAYGWQLGIFIATCVSMLGSALGAVACFLLGRYLMRDMVKRWIRKYPLFDAIDIAASEHGLRIMAMLYLTPILPLGPVSYMCGTTSLKLSHFILAKIAALPLMMLYVLIGASTGTLISTSKGGTTNDSTDQVKSIEENETLIIAGIVLSFASIAGITHYIKKELNHILERQKRQLDTELTSINKVPSNSHDIEVATSGTTSNNLNNTTTTIEIGKDVTVTPSSTILDTGTVPRQRKHEKT